MSMDRDKALKNYFEWCKGHLFTEGTDDDLFAFISLFCGFNIPRVSVCEGHCSPFQFIADTFFEREQEVLVIANRNGGKTQNFGIKNVLDGVLKHCEIASVGAILPQAKRCYKYSSSILNNEWFSPHILNSIQESTLIRNVHGGASELAILAGTANGVNSPHPQKANLDEVELMKWSVLQEAMSMPKSNDYAKSSLCITSSLKYGHGAMVKLMDGLDNNGLKLYSWCIFETMEQCKDERSGTFPVQLIFRKSGDADLSTETVFTKDPSHSGKLIDYVTTIKGNEYKYSGCLGCKLVTTCYGKARNSRGYYTIDDTIKKYLNLDEDTWVSQWLSKRVGSKGRIYPVFSPEVHGIDSYTFNPNLETIFGIDLGFTNPAVLLAGQIQPDDSVVIFDEFYKSGLSSPEFISTVVIPYINKYNPTFVYIDPSGADEIQQCKDKGLGKIVVPADNSVDSGIKTVRSFLMTASREVKLKYVKSKCPNFDREMRYYHNIEDTDKPVKEDDHTPDATRYMLHSRFPMIAKKRKFGASSN
jgi:hypothetical protein